jgi:poly(3-hydroxybutyrate) depolymerase
VKAKLLDTAYTMGQESVRMMAGVLGIKTPISVRVLIEAAASRFRIGTRITLMAGGLSRTALYFKPTKPSSGQAPLVIGLHQHNGNGPDFAAMTDLPASWPEATLIYPDGLPGAKGEDDYKSGWQKNIGDVGDRDLLLFDELLKFVASDQKISRLKKVYVAGFSNGANLAYLLWSDPTRSKSISAVAACAGVSIYHDLDKKLLPKPAVLIHGYDDRQVKWARAEGSIKAVLKANKARDSFTGWPPGTTRNPYPPRPGGADTLVITHPGRHTWPPEFSPDVKEFFLEY